MRFEIQFKYSEYFDGHELGYHMTLLVFFHSVPNFSCTKIKATSPHSSHTHSFALTLTSDVLTDKSTLSAELVFWHSSDTFVQ